MLYVIRESQVRSYIDFGLAWEIPYPMSMQVVLPEESLPAKLTLNPESPMSDDEYYEFCQANADVRFERTAQG